MRTASYTHESTFRHSTGVQPLFSPVGGWVEPPDGTCGADTPSSKRRTLSLVQASGLSAEPAFPASIPAGRETPELVHTPDDLDRFEQAGDAGGGDLGSLARFARGGYEIAATPTGLAVTAVPSGRHADGDALCRPSGHRCMSDLPKGSGLFANVAVAVQAARRTRPGQRVAAGDWDEAFDGSSRGAIDGYAQRLTTVRA